jgi:hypothetical protein
MGSLTNYAENALIKHITREAAYSPAATLYLLLCTGDPGEAATGASCNEVANTGSYARTAIAFAAAASRAIANSGTVTFTTLTGSLGTVSHFAIADSGTYGAGNVLAYGQFSSSKSLVSGNTPTVAAGEVSISMNTGVYSNYAANGFLDRMFRNQAFTVGGNYIGLATATISDSTTAPTEVANSNAYSRLTINASGGAQPSWAAASGNSVANANQWTMPTPSGSWGTVVAAFMSDSGTHSAGYVLLYDNGITDQAVGADDVVYWPTGQFSLTQD